MKLNKILFTIERTEEKTENNFIFKVHSLRKSKKFKQEELEALFKFFLKQEYEPEICSSSCSILLHKLESLLDFSYGEFHETNY